MTEQLDMQTTPQATEPTDTTVTDKWYDTLPEHLRLNPNVTKYPSLEKFMEADIERAKLMGKRFKELSPEEVKQFVSPEEIINHMRASGLPTTIDEYKFSEEVESRLDPTISSDLKQRALTAGISPSQVEEMMRYQAELHEKTFQEQRTHWADSVIETYGKDTHRVLSMANKALDKFAPEGLHDYIKTAGLENHPMLIKLCYNIAQEMLPDAMPNMKGGNTHSSQVVEARNRVTSLLTDKKFMTRWKEGKSDAVSELQQAYVKLAELEG